jgi:hypothetical protein
MEPHGTAEIDREDKIDDSAGRESERLDFEKNAHGGEVAGAAAEEAASGNRQIDRSRDPVSFE